MDAIFAALLLKTALLLCATPSPRLVPHGWRAITPCTYLLDRRAIRCTRAQCFGAIVTVDEHGLTVTPFTRRLRPRCTMTLTPTGLVGCDALRMHFSGKGMATGSGALGTLRSGDSDVERPTTCRIAPQIQDTTYVEAGGDVPDDLVCARSRSWCLFVREHPLADPTLPATWRVQARTRKVVGGMVYRCAKDRRIPRGVTYWWDRPPTGGTV